LKLFYGFPPPTKQDRQDISGTTKKGWKSVSLDVTIEEDPEKVKVPFARCLEERPSRYEKTETEGGNP